MIEDFVRISQSWKCFWDVLKSRCVRCPDGSAYLVLQFISIHFNNAEWWIKQNAQSDPNYASLFRGRPQRFVLPLKPQRDSTKNLNRLSYSSSSAQWTKKGSVLIQPEVLCQLGCETPRINYEVYNGRPYRYFYAISSDVDADNPGTLIKVDTLKKTCKTWAEPNLYASEPVFIAHPDAKSEDHGVVLSSLIWGGDNECRTGLLILDAVSWTELGRTEFHTPSPVPKCLHGWYHNDGRWIAYTNMHLYSHIDLF